MEALDQRMQLPIRTRSSQQSLSIVNSLGRFFCCLQEVIGKVGAIVKKHLFDPKNVVITCSKSVKLTTSLVAYWLDTFFLPSIGKDTLLLSDSWSAQNDPKLYQDASSTGKHIKQIQIPQHTTDGIQPSDKYFNHQLKNFVETLYHHVGLDEICSNGIILFVLSLSFTTRWVLQYFER